MVLNDHRGSHVTSSARRDEITRGFHERTVKMGINQPFKINALDYESKKKTLQKQILAKRKKATSDLYEDKDTNIKKRELVNLYK